MSMGDVKMTETKAFSSESLEQKKRRMIWSNRIKLGIRIIGIAILVSFLFSIYRGLTYFYFDRSGKSFQFERAVITLVELHGDGLKVDKDIRLIKVSPLLKQSITAKVYRQVGEQKRIIGELHAEQSLFGEIRYTLDDNPQYLNGNTLNLWVPMSVIYGGGEKALKREEEAIKQLGHIEDGFVSEMSFTLTKAMPPQQLAELLSDYDLWITAMPMYSGEMKEVKLSNYSTSGDSMYVPHLTLRPFFSYSEDGLGRTEATSISTDDIDMASQQMMKDLEWLTTHVNYNGVQEEKQRLTFLKNNGIQVYGAVVTGPVRELEKLKEVPAFHNFGLGQIEVWNWK